MGDVSVTRVEPPSHHVQLVWLTPPPDPPLEEKVSLPTTPLCKATATTQKENVYVRALNGKRAKGKGQLVDLLELAGVSLERGLVHGLRVGWFSLIDVLICLLGIGFGMWAMDTWPASHTIQFQLYKFQEKTFSFQKKLRV